MVDRLHGIDAARALAFAGMVFAHYAGAMREDDPGWLQVIDNVADGRAAPLFCLLLGLGAGILSARGTPDRVVIRRGLALLAAGVAMWPFVERVYLILPHYGVLLLAYPLFRRLPTRALLPLALVAFLVPSAITAVLDDHGMRAGAEPDRYVDLLDPWYVARQLTWTGGYPLVGWAGFVLVGTWVARQTLSARTTQVRLLVGGAALAGLQPLAGRAFAALAGTPSSPESGGWAAFFEATAHSNRTAWYLLASGSAVAVVAGCLLASRSAPVRALAPLGRQALSAYVLHLLLGIVVWRWLDRDVPPLTAQVLVVVATVAGLAVAAAAWARWFRRGPLEALMRAVTG